MTTSFPTPTHNPPPQRSPEDEIRRFPSPHQVLDLIKEGTIDGVQIHKCAIYSFIKLFKDGKVVQEIVDLDSGEDIMCAFRQRCQEVHEQDESTVFHDEMTEKKVRKILFRQGKKTFVYLSHGISARFNYCELFNAAASKNRKKVTLDGKVKSFLVDLKSLLGRPRIV